MDGGPRRNCTVLALFVEKVTMRPTQSPITNYHGVGERS